MFRVTLLLVVALFSAITLATEEDAYSVSSGWQLGLGAGYGKLDNPLAQSEDIPLYIIPQIELFYGDFAFTNFELSWTPYTSEHHQVSVVTKMNRDGLYFIDDLATSSFISSLTTAKPPNSPRPGGYTGNSSNTVKRSKRVGDMTQIPDRKISVMGGMQYLFDWHSWRVSAGFFSELTNYYSGQQGNISLSKLYSIREHLFVLSAQMQYQSNELTRYYYGSHRDEASVGFSIYQPKHAFNASMQITYQYQINEQWRVISDLKWQRLDSEIGDSPLVADRHLLSYYAGVAWSF
ncbi:MipA/OmpV family protein [Pseudoalteromonas sp. SSDWG2]|uniref:MipA/OmpV family protein n=1 Tax=Pseudoalteromonas sp. SSDWG2 TaxID=3139391 RepID=UPI003BA9E327